MGAPDYEDVDPEVAVEDFKKRRENYLGIYETVDERDGSYIKIINNQTFIVHNARGYLPQKVRHGDVCWFSLAFSCRVAAEQQFAPNSALRHLLSRWSTL